MTPDAKTLERHPLITEAGVALLERLREHADAPRFNYATGDRLRAEDRPVVERYREQLTTERLARAPGPPPPAVVARVAMWRETVPFFRRTLPSGADLERDWETLPTTSRADVGLHARGSWCPTISRSSAW